MRRTKQQLIEKLERRVEQQGREIAGWEEVQGELRVKYQDECAAHGNTRRVLSDAMERIADLEERLVHAQEEQIAWLRRVVDRKTPATEYEAMLAESS